ncbi:50S ribosomal protein L11 methyltransferase [Alphaproteobacteria bacterium]|nr:50S ribosomal protein L11 methyltransferase [Alphaproteobacteria bacterium]
MTSSKIDSQQKEALWQLTVMVPVEGVLVFQEEFSTTPIASSFHDLENGVYAITHLYDHDPDQHEIAERIKTLTAQLEWSRLPLWHIAPVQDKDWVAESQKSFVPFEVGAFFVYSSCYTGDLPADKKALQVDAAQAFGTGSHETTAGCLEALDQLKQDGEAFQHILDFGCGTAILAMGAAQLWPHADVMAIDNDTKAVAEARKNIVFNDLEGIQVRCGETPLADGGGRYDLIVANVLLAPLQELCSSMVKALAPGGTLILSGILASQVETLKTSYAGKGMTAMSEITYGDWAVVRLRKS